MRRQSLAERFWSKVRILKPDECWEWKSTLRKDGYGEFVIANKTRKGKHVLSHRVAWELVNGPIPKKLHVLHHCDNPPCCNPAHLFIGTQKDNNDDKNRKGRGVKGERVTGSKLTIALVKEIVAHLENGESQSSIARLYGVKQSSISDIDNGVTWRHVTNKTRKEG